MSKEKSVLWPIARGKSSLGFEDNATEKAFSNLETYFLTYKNC